MIVRYEHHGRTVAVQEHLKGRHREHCLCYKCDLFKPEDHEKNCSKASLLFALDVAMGITTPVWECDSMKEKGVV